MSENMAARVLRVVKDDPEVINLEISHVTGIKIKQVSRVLYRLVRDGYVKRLGVLTPHQTGNRRLFLTKRGHNMITNAERGFMSVSKPAEQRGHPIRRPCLKCRKSFDSDDRRKEWVCKGCKQGQEWKAA